MAHKRKAGDRVKLSTLAFKNGVYAETAAALALRGTVLRPMRKDPAIFVVRWDQKKTPDQLHQDFLMGETTHRY